MKKINIYNQSAEKVAEKELSAKVFGLKMNETLVHQAMVTQMANERQVLAHTKDRSEVRGGGKKPWKQKGTGRARHGSSRSPIWIGGGVTFGPRKDRNFKKDINIKMKKKALMMVLSDRAINDNMIVLDKMEMQEYKTKAFNDIIKKLEATAIPVKSEEKGEKKKAKRSILIINDKKDDKVTRSGRNLAGVELINLDNLNILDLLRCKVLILTEEGVKKLEARYSK